MGMFGALSNQGLGIVAGDEPRSRAPFVIHGAQQKGGSESPWKAALGGLLDSILTQTGGKAINMPLMLARREREQGLEDEGRKRSQDLEDAIALAKAKAQFREPTALAQNVEYLNSLHPGLGDSYATNFSNPMSPVDQTGPDGSVTRQWLRPPMLPLAQPPQSAPQMPNSTPTGSPLRGPANSKVIQGPKGPMQVWLVNGEWYDNPEGH